MRFACPRCKQEFSIDISLEGEFAYCPACGLKAHIPAQSSSQGDKESLRTPSVPVGERAGPATGRRAAASGCEAAQLPVPGRLCPSCNAIIPISSINCPFCKVSVEESDMVLARGRKLAKWSLGFGIASLVFSILTALFAIWFGFSSLTLLKNTGDSSQAKARWGILLGIIMSLVFILMLILKESGR